MRTGVPVGPGVAAGRLGWRRRQPVAGEVMEETVPGVTRSERFPRDRCTRRLREAAGTPAVYPLRSPPTSDPVVLRRGPGALSDNGSQRCARRTSAGPPTIGAAAPVPNDRIGPARGNRPRTSGADMTASDWSPDEPQGTETFEQGDDAIDEATLLDPDFVEELQLDPALDPNARADELELEEAGAELDDPEDLVTLDGGIDDPDGLGGPTNRDAARSADGGGVGSRRATGPGRRSRGRRPLIVPRPASGAVRPLHQHAAGAGVDGRHALVAVDAQPLVGLPALPPVDQIGLAQQGPGHGHERRSPRPGRAAMVSRRLIAAEQDERQVERVAELAGVGQEEGLLERVVLAGTACPPP